MNVLKQLFCKHYFKINHEKEIYMCKLCGKTLTIAKAYEIDKAEARKLLKKMGY